MEIPVGLKNQKKIIVENKDSAKSLGSGGLDVFGTPAMIALMENTALHMIRPYLPEGSDSVGIMINTKHLKASPIGAEITCEATVTAVDGKKVSYTITCHDETGEKIGESEHDRFIVDIERFISKLNR
ncbi:MAG: thioesterase family protein [Bacteroidales bacterium]|nr:thioesterase family protein [Bacteroidales bacterium]